MWPFCYFQYGFRSSRSTADLLTVVSDRIARAFNKSGAAQAVTLDISKAVDRVWHAGLFHKLKSYGISGHIFGLISSFLSPVNAGVPQGSILSVIGHLICGNDLNWLLNLNLICKTLWTGVKSGLLISLLGNLSWFCLTGLITMGLLI